MSYLTNTYNLQAENFFYEPNRNLTGLHRNYYYPNNSKNNNINNYIHSKKEKNYFNSSTKNSNHNLRTYELNDLNNFKFDLSHKNINFNTKSDQKIKLTYEFENISPNEITDKQKELINLQLQMCDLNSENNTYKNTKRKNNSNKKFSKSQKSLRNNFLSGLTTYKHTNYKSFKKNKTFNELLNSNGNFSISINDNNKSKIKRASSLKKNVNKFWKDKCAKLDEEISDMKNKIKKLKSDNSILSKRINNIKEKEDKKNLIYDKNYKIKKFNDKLLDKLKLSEEIKKKQIELIIKMQKEVNNMRLKLHMLGEFCA